jgi:hypothetical protein
MTFDQPLFLVVVDHPGGPYIPETDLADTRLARVCKHIRDGQFKNVLAVLELDPVAHTLRDVTHDFETLFPEP